MKWRCRLAIQLNHMRTKLQSNSSGCCCICIALLGATFIVTRWRCKSIRRYPSYVCIRLAPQRTDFKQSSNYMQKKSRDETILGIVGHSNLPGNFHYTASGTLWFFGHGVCAKVRFAGRWKVIYLLVKRVNRKVHHFTNEPKSQTKSGCTLAYCHLFAFTVFFFSFNEMRTHFLVCEFTSDGKWVRLAAKSRVSSNRCQIFTEILVPQKGSLFSLYFDAEN